MSKIFVYYCCVSELDLAHHEVKKVYEFKSHEVKIFHKKIDALIDLRNILDAHIEASIREEI